MANFKDALLEGVGETAKPSTPKADAPAKAEETVPATPEAPVAPKTTVHKQNENKIYYGIGLKTYSTVIAGLPVYVEAGKPWQGTKYQYDALKRAKLIQ